MKLDKDREPVELEHKVKLRGATSPFDFFTITCPPEGKHYIVLVVTVCSLYQLKTLSNVECIERPAGVINGQRKQFGGSGQGGKYIV